MPGQPARAPRSRARDGPARVIGRADDGGRASSAGV